jgi:hypothetical protein
MNSIDLGPVRSGLNRDRTEGDPGLERLSRIEVVMAKLADYLSHDDLFALRAVSSQLHDCVSACYMEPHSLDEFRRLAGRDVTREELMQLKWLGVHPELSWLEKEGGALTARLFSLPLFAKEAQAACAAADTPLHAGRCSEVGFERAIDAVPRSRGFVGAIQNAQGHREYWHMGVGEQMRLPELPIDHYIPQGRPRVCHSTCEAPRQFLVLDSGNHDHVLDAERNALTKLPGQPQGLEAVDKCWEAQSPNGRYIAYVKTVRSEPGATAATPQVLVLYDLEKGTREERVLSQEIHQAPVLTDAGTVIVQSSNAIIEFMDPRSVRVLWEGPREELLNISADGRFAIHRKGGSGDLWVADLRVSHHRTDGREIRLPGTLYDITSIAVSPMGERIALTDALKRVLVYDLWAADANGAPQIAKSTLGLRPMQPQAFFSGVGQVDVLSLVFTEPSSRGCYLVQSHTLPMKEYQRGSPRWFDPLPDSLRACTLL